MGAKPPTISPRIGMQPAAWRASNVDLPNNHFTILFARRPIRDAHSRLLVLGRDAWFHHMQFRIPYNLFLMPRLAGDFLASHVKSTSIIYFGPSPYLRPPIFFTKQNVTTPFALDRQDVLLPIGFAPIANSGSLPRRPQQVPKEKGQPNWAVT